MLHKLHLKARNVYRKARAIWRGGALGAFDTAMGTIPLLIADKTYNGAHPDYDPAVVRNFPGRILNGDKPNNNALYAEIRKLAFGQRVPRIVWRPQLKRTLAEAATVPGYEQVMERKAYVERYLADMGQKYGAHYAAGWVTMADALYLYWVVRHLQPKVIVQTGVSNGLSSAFMMLALAKNGPDGKLYTVDIPAIFNSADPAWTRRGVVYGVAIPEGKSSGWLVPDIYRDRFEVSVGDAKDLLPKLIDRLDHVDLFFHDSDHSYAHMMFENEQAMRKLVPGGVILADDVSWNASLWDFADAQGVPSYNFKGTIGAAFFPK
jgi:predicted O-methyltransferase YrrM